MIEERGRGRSRRRRTVRREDRSREEGVEEEDGGVLRTASVGVHVGRGGRRPVGEEEEAGTRVDEDGDGENRT